MNVTFTPNHCIHMVFLTVIGEIALKKTIDKYFTNFRDIVNLMLFSECALIVIGVFKRHLSHRKQ